MFKQGVARETTYAYVIVDVRGHDAISHFIIINIKIHSSCEVEYFVETHLCKLCVILRSRVLRVV